MLSELIIEVQRLRSEVRDLSRIFDPGYDYPFVPVCRVGSFDIGGNPRRVVTITDENMNLIVHNFDPEKSPVPLVVGHPQKHEPAWGFIKELRREGDILYCKPYHVISRFALAVRRGLYRYISLSINAETWEILHVGFLGGNLPGAFGLPGVRF